MTGHDPLGELCPATGAIGGLAFGGIAFGGLAFGLVALGGLAIGGLALAPHAVGGTGADPELLRQLERRLPGIGEFSSE